MSIIAAVRKNDQTFLAADTLTCFGDSHRVPQSNAITPKIRRIGGVVVGGSGWGVYDRILDAHLAEQPDPPLSNEPEIFAFFMDLWRVMHDKYSFVNDQAGSKDSPFGDLDSSFLVGSPHGIYKVSPDMDVSRFDQYYAIGSGAEYALGALYNLYEWEESGEIIARSAVESAIAFDVYCGGEITVMQV